MTRDIPMPPIQAPKTPERIAAELAYASVTDVKKSMAIESDKKRGLHINYTKLRVEFELYVLNHYHCPKGRGQLALDVNGVYKYPVYARNNLLEISQLEHLWQSYVQATRAVIQSISNES